MSDIPIAWSGAAPQAVTDALAAFREACASWPKTPYDSSGPNLSVANAAVTCEVATAPDPAQVLNHSVSQAFRDGISLTIAVAVFVWIVWWFLATGIEFFVKLIRRRRETP